jgi:hypothetical protein
VTLTGPYAQAAKHWWNLEQCLSCNPHLKEQYDQFLKEYLNLGHMSLSTHPGAFFIPHHAVTKVTPSRCKLRVVFDASSKGVQGKSLNDFLLSIPKLQKDIFEILLGFRVHAIAFTANIVKLYRQTAFRKPP